MVMVGLGEVGLDLTEDQMGLMVQPLLDMAQGVASIQQLEHSGNLVEHYMQEEAEAV